MIAEGPHRIVAALIVCASLLTLAVPALAQVPPDDEPQQSTTGPEPPPGVAPKLDEDAEPDESEVTIPGVPGYSWRHGCGPTAVGMVVGYHDMSGFDDLFDGDATTQTGSVNQGIASQRDAGDPGHYEDYSLPKENGGSILPDKSELPAGDEHSHDCIADFMKTSWSSANNKYGWSWSSHISPAYTQYVQQRNPQYVPTCTRYSMSSGTLSWSVLTQEIDAGRPMVFLVDTNANGSTDHFVTIVGYRENPTQQYGCLDTWYPYDTIRWCDFEQMASGQSWGVHSGWAFDIDASTEPPWRIFDAMLGTLPDQQGWTEFIKIAGATPSIVGDALHLGPTDLAGSQVYIRSDLPFDFGRDDFRMEAAVQVIQSTTSGNCRAGFVMIAQDGLGRAYTIWLAEDRVLLFNHPNTDCSATPEILTLDTTDAFHTYRFDVVGGMGTLIVDGDPNLTISLEVGLTGQATTNLNTAGFGDYAGDTWCEVLVRRFCFGNDGLTLTVTEQNEPWGEVLTWPNYTSYFPGTEILLSGEAIEGKVLSHWLIYDPNWPGDANHAASDVNNPMALVIQNDVHAEAVFKCGSGSGQALPLAACFLATMLFVGRKGRGLFE